MLLSRHAPRRVLIEALEPRRLFTTVPTGFIDETVASGLNAPTAMVQAPDGRLFVAEQDGDIRIVKDDVLLDTPLMTVPRVEIFGERGLVGLTVDPDFATNGHFYVYYTSHAGDVVFNRLSRFTAVGDTALASTEQVLLNLDPMQSTIHNGGSLHFGPDGKLYVAVGEDAHGENSQSLETLKGKILRINPDGTIPTDNPFYNVATGDNRLIWAMGLRNPFSFAFQPGTGRMLINDVGSASFEEINEGTAGANYGWPYFEGPLGAPDYTQPLYSYGRSDGQAITGAAFYNPATLNFGPDYEGDFFFADIVFGFIKRLDVDNGNAVVPFATDVPGPVDLDVTPDGQLLYLDYGHVANAGRVGRISFSPASPPVITRQPESGLIPSGTAVTLRVEANGPEGAGSLTYQWQKNGVDVPGATAASLLLGSTEADSGLYQVIVSNTHGSTASAVSDVTITPNEPPVPIMIYPLEGAHYWGGRLFSFLGVATDAEDGFLPKSAFTWWVDFHHNTHSHPFIPPTSGVRRGLFTIPTLGETATDVWYRVYMKVTDSTGASVTIRRDIQPRIVFVTMRSNIPGASFTLDGQPQPELITFRTVAGIEREIGMIAPPPTATESYSFRSWLAGNPHQTRTIRPLVNRLSMAVFSRTPITAIQSSLDQDDDDEELQ